MDAPFTKAAVLEWAKTQGVEITHTSPTVMNPEHHVHADIEAPRTVFRAHGLHNLGLWDDVAAPDWREIGKELAEANIGPCDIKDCDYCGEET